MEEVELGGPLTLWEVSPRPAVRCHLHQNAQVSLIGPLREHVIDENLPHCSSCSAIGRSSAPQTHRFATKALRTSSAPLHEYNSMSICTTGASTKVPIPLPDMATPYASAFLRWK